MFFSEEIFVLLALRLLENVDGDVEDDEDAEEVVEEVDNEGEDEERDIDELSKSEFLEVFLSSAFILFS